MNRTQILQSIIDATNATEYLEIGVQYGTVFDNIKCEYKIGIDPALKQDMVLNAINPQALRIKCTSDCYFKEHIAISHRHTTDVVFIDGLHHAEQVIRDFDNCLDFACHSESIIVLHDCNPERETLQRRQPVEAEWCGDVWKAWVNIAGQTGGFVVNTDYGVGIIDLSSYKRPGVVYAMEHLEYKDLRVNRKNVLNLKSIQYFANWVSYLPKVS